MEKQEVSALVVLDLGVAFDNVRHDIVLDVLEKSFGLKIKH